MLLKQLANHLMPTLLKTFLKIILQNIFVHRLNAMQVIFFTKLYLI